MKKIIFTCCLLFGLLLQTYGQENTPQTSEKTIVLTIEGMACQAGCADVINENLKQLQGISNSTVNFETGKAVLTYNPDKSTLEIIKETIEATKVKSYSYAVTRIETKD